MEGNFLVPIHYFYEALHNAPPSGDLKAAYDDYVAVKLLQQGRTRQALQFLDWAIQLDPTHIEIFENRAVAYARLGRLREALSMADRDVAAAPGAVDALLNRSALRDLSGDWIGALNDLGQVLKQTSPDWPGQEETMAAMEKLRAKMAAGH